MNGAPKGLSEPMQIQTFPIFNKTNHQVSVTWMRLDLEGLVMWEFIK